ncbi:hypothetical protein NGC80_00025 [Staphylococcus chromogenes]|nr:hypothetical protein [Staphylococcus chromogenes]
MFIVTLISLVIAIIKISHKNNHSQLWPSRNG